MKHFKTLNALFICFALPLIMKAQSIKMENGKSNQNSSKVEVPEVGKLMPDFTLNEVTNYSKTTASLSDFKGKWLILDFWATTCGGCIASFPKVNAFQEKYKDKIQFVLVGDNEHRFGKNIKSLYSKHEAVHQLNLVSAYDSVLSKKYGIRVIPHQIVIDPTGIVKARTNSITENQLNALIHNKEVKFSAAGEDRLDAFDNNGNLVNSSNLLYSSTLAKSTTNETQRMWPIEPYKYPLQDGTFKLMPNTELLKGIYSISKWPLLGLYNLAYNGQTQGPLLASEYMYGKTSRYPILEVKDTTPFEFSFNPPDTGIVMKGLYNYSVRFPKDKSDPKAVMEMMQYDLKKMFGYDVVREKRDMPCWKLVKKGSASQNLKSKGGDSKSSEFSSAGFNLVNLPIRVVIDQLAGSNQSEPPFIDYTGIAGNIDIKVDAILKDLNVVKTELNKYGLDLVKGKTQMDVWVIKDSIVSK